ncbi:MAG: hypothetical protein UW03_C0037G0010 [Candidatus Peregrinibacteria bacterium GW2011_GWA2_43_8]|nr:MAG: hypothetical protein UW03_C0037G0010 [Candidatus Peregrinibacteria bacterium GW2011_GWA2_43_8]
MFEGIIWWQILVAILLALAPVFIWVEIMLKRKQHSIKSLVKVFLLGTLTVLPLIGIQYLWIFHPEWDVYLWIDQNIDNQRRRQIQHTCRTRIRFLGKHLVFLFGYVFRKHGGSVLHVSIQIKLHRMRTHDIFIDFRLFLRTWKIFTKHS